MTTYLKNVAYGAGAYVAVGNAGIIITSTNGTDWTQVATDLTILDINGITFGRGLFVAVGDRRTPTTPSGPGLVLCSANGVDWSFGTHTVQKNLRGVTVGSASFVIVGNDGTILRSTHGSIWFGQSGVLGLGDGQNLRDIAWGARQYVAVGNEDIILTSPDGQSWIRWYPGTGVNLHGVAYGQGIFVVTGNAGTILRSGILFSLQGLYRQDIGAFELTITGEGERAHRIQVSTNLTAWTDLWAFTNAEPVTTFLDMTATNLVQQYYRVVSP